MALRVGILGCGFISARYLTNLPAFEGLEVVACADLDDARAEGRAKEFGIEARPVSALLGGDDIDLIVNLTNPAAHVDTSAAILASGKHLYSEKPLALTVADGRMIMDVAALRGLVVGCAPDTFLGGGLQTCRAMLDDGAIGTPTSFSAAWVCPGHELWHDNPDFYYQIGGGPLFDMGPYALTAIVSLLGPVARVAGMARRSGPTRTIATGKRAGETIPVQTPTHIVATLELRSGILGTVTMSFDTWTSDAPFLEIQGTTGTLSCGDPDTFAGPVRICGPAESGPWRDVPIQRPYVANSRGLGVAELAESLARDERPRASGWLALHVLSVMEAILRSADERRFVDVEWSCERPAPLPA